MGTYMGTYIADLQVMHDGNPVLLPSEAPLKLYDGTLIKPTGECNLKADHDGKMFHIKFQVMETSQLPLLSADT
jgi:hypothetical protein